jgi:SAM-dependent methyltransferase
VNGIAPYPSAQLSDSSCLLCGARRGGVLALESRVSRIRAPARIVKCAECGLGFVSPQPDAATLESYYTEEFEPSYRQAGIAYAGGTTAVAPHLRDRLVDCERTLGKKGSLLDVGVGSGTFIGHARARGWTVTGTELSRSSATRVQATGVNVLVGDVGELELPEGSFDVIHMNHVLEHMRDPARALRRMGKALRPGGLIVVEVPYEFGDLAFQLRRWTGRLRPYPVSSPHLFFFTPATLRRLLHQTGFSVESLTTTRRDAGGSWSRRAARRCIHMLERIADNGPFVVAVARSQRAPA